MRRLVATLALSSGLACAAAGGALGQTVADYEAALSAAQIASPASAADVSRCLPLVNYVFTSIPDEGRVAVTLPLIALDGSAVPGKEEKREVCAAVRKQAVISFDSGNGEEIVTPAKALDPRDARGPYYRDPSLSGPSGDVLAPRMNRNRTQVPGAVQ
ncbi:hypothetical protein [Azospirillum thermophilum]|uniref:Uncharacterized protein n=1 Tax=Azospirillum thermophilum TaxID=2202148 RepID=A0A2S2CSX8_9PROT|nr:hypothetical protein [Azospirillum thermophilum]AWK87602.1 hypothetical protein DEW08_16500 [Azospirillum thermophilum]